MSQPLEVNYNISHPESPDVRAALFNFAHNNEHTTGIVFLNELKARTPEDSGTDHYEDGISAITDRLDVHDATRQAGTLARVIIIDAAGGIEVFPPLPDAQENEALCHEIFAVAEAAGGSN